MKNYINSLLSDISYIQILLPNSNLDLALAQNRYITEKEVALFNKYFKIIEQNTQNNGFSAIAFELKENL